VGFANVGKYATVRFAIAHLDWSGTFEVNLTRGDDDEGTMFADLTAHKNHTTSLRLSGMSRSGDIPVKCRGVATRYDVTQEEVVIQVPWSCIPTQTDPTVEFGAVTRTRRVAGGRVDNVKIQTHNAPEGMALVKHAR